MTNQLERRIVDNKHGQRYCIVGPKMAIDFHFSEGIDHDIVAGLEMHYKECPSYLKGREPFSEQCWLTGTRCWGDGTSLYATEYLYPLFKEGGIDVFWPILEEEYERRLVDAFGKS